MVVALSVRNLSTGETAVFDDSARQLFLIQSGLEYDLSRGAADLQALVDAGSARSFDQETLESVSQALSKMVLLDCGGR